MRARLVPLCTVALLAALSAGLGLAVGAGTWAPGAVWDALCAFDPTDFEHVSIRDSRTPRVVLGLVAGAAFAVAGCVLQSLTRNPLAAPALVGVQPGAMLAVVLGLSAAGYLPPRDLALLALCGAACGAGLVFGLASVVRGASAGVGLLLAGMAVGLTLGAVANWLVLSQSLGRDLLFWQTGALVHARWDVLATLAPVWVAGFGIAAGLAGPLRIMALGEDSALALGARPRLIRAAGMLCALLLAGATVSAVGPIPFVGLLVPHFVRSVVGLDERVVLPVSAAAGGVLLVLCDTAARFVRAPRETPVGVLLMGIGALFFLVQMRRRSSRRMALAGGDDGGN